MAPDAHEMLPQDFRLEERREGEFHVLAPHGDLDIATAGRLSEAADAVPADTHTLVVDLRGVTFLDSSGLRGLLLARRRAARDGMEYLVVHDPETHGEILRLTQLDRELPIVAGDELSARLGGRG